MNIPFVDPNSAPSLSKLLNDAPGPSPWWCRAPVPSSFGLLTWQCLKHQNVINALTDPEGRPRLCLPMTIWFQMLSDGWMLLWNNTRNPGVGSPASVLVQLLKIDHLQPLNDADEWSVQKPMPSRAHFKIAPEFSSSFEFFTSYEPGRHYLSLPSLFKNHVPEFFVVTDNPALPKPSDGASSCIYAIDPKEGRVDVFPQDWFNNAKLDYGYQWITCVIRDPTTRRLVVTGIRIGGFVLDETGRQVEWKLPPQVRKTN